MVAVLCLYLSFLTWHGMALSLGARDRDRDTASLGCVQQWGREQVGQGAGQHT